MRPLLITLFLAGLVLYPSSVSAERVIFVHDGDTFTIEGGQRVRISGIDAPELGQFFAYESRNYLRRLILGKDVTLNCNGVTYDRIACKVFWQNLDIQKEMVGWGLAFDYPYFSHGVYQPAQTYAQKMRRGVWGMFPDGGQRPWGYRKKERHAPH